MNKFAQTGTRFCKTVYNDIKPHFVAHVKTVLEAVLNGEKVELKRPDRPWKLGPEEGVQCYNFLPRRQLGGDFEEDDPDGWWPFDDEEDKKKFGMDPATLDRIYQSMNPLRIEDAIRDEDGPKQEVIPSFNNPHNHVAFVQSRWLVIGHVVVAPDPRTITGVERTAHAVVTSTDMMPMRPRFWAIKISNNGGHDSRVWYVVWARELAQAQSLRLMLTDLVGGDGRKMELGQFCDVLRNIRTIAYVFET